MPPAINAARPTMTTCVAIFAEGRKMAAIAILSTSGDD
jgi:hypothetical protein